MAKLKLYRHYKGGHYVELGRAVMRGDESGGEWNRRIVYYRPISTLPETTYARDAEEFDGFVTIDHADGRPSTTRVRRFEYLGDIYA